VRHESAEEIAAAERKEQALRHEALKPSAAQDKAVRDAEAATVEARQDAATAVQEQQKDTAEAKAKLRDTEARFAATKARDEFVTAHNAKLKAAADRIDTLKDRASKEEGATKDATDAEITKLQKAHDRADDALDKVKSETDVLKWAMDRENVQQAFNDLQTEMDQSK
jgi:chromosome segregation ATPase